jgi:hypothetical protein
MKWGLVDHLRDTSGRKIPEGDVFVGWLNREIRRQKPPSIAIREDGLELFIELGDFLNTRIPGFREARPKKGDLISHSEARRHAQKRFGWVDNQYQDKDGTGRYLEDTPQWAQ